MSIARAYDQDTRMAQGPPPSQISMDYFRSLHKRVDDNALAPNGRPIDDYGQKGQRVPAYLTTTCNDTSDLIERVIIHRLMNPFMNHVWNRLSKVVQCFSSTRRKQDKSDNRKRFLSSRYVSAAATVFACMLSNACLAAAIGTLYHVNSLENRLIVVSLFGIFFSAPAVLLGKHAIRTWMLGVA